MIFQDILFSATSQCSNCAIFHLWVNANNQITHPSETSETKYQQKMITNLVLKKLLQFTLENKINYEIGSMCTDFAQPSFNTNEAPAITYRIYLILLTLSR